MVPSQSSPGTAPGRHTLLTAGTAPPLQWGRRWLERKRGVQSTQDRGHQPEGAGIPLSLSPGASHSPERQCFQQ